MSIPNVLFISLNRLPRSGSSAWCAAGLSASASAAAGCAAGDSTGELHRSASENSGELSMGKGNEREFLGDRIPQ